MPIELQAADGSEGARKGISTNEGYDDGEEWGEQPTGNNPFFNRQREDDSSSSSSSSSDDDDDDEEDDDELDNKQHIPQVKFTFPDLTLQIQATFSTLHTKTIFPKLDWSSPKDAKWVNGNSLKCCSAGDVYALLKSSDFVMHDLEVSGKEAMSHNYSHNLIIRKYTSLTPSGEFRCFCSPSKVLAVSQRDTTTNYPYLLGMKDQIVKAITTFHREQIKEVFNPGPDGCYVMDVYLDRQQKVWVVDFGVWGGWSEALLFEWGEVVEIKRKRENEEGEKDVEVEFGDDGDDVEFRIVEDESSIKPDPLSSYRAPVDAVHLVSEEGFDTFKGKCVRPSQR